jgi:predicted Zn-ribbon and HTH transcriptional regulator
VSAEVVEVDNPIYMLKKTKEEEKPHVLRKAKCKCGYEWTTTVKLNRATCPNCARKAKVGDGE